jgi:hypothetical protein
MLVLQEHHLYLSTGLDDSGEEQGAILIDARPEIAAVVKSSATEQAVYPLSRLLK